MQKKQILYGVHLIVSLLLIISALLTEHPWWNVIGLVLLALLGFYPSKLRQLVHLFIIFLLSLGMFAIGRPYQEQSLFNDATEVLIDGLSLQARLSNSIGEYEVPVLVYHKVVPKPASDDPFEYPLVLFKEEMDYLAKAGYTTLSLSEYKAILFEGKQGPQKPILLTFDDITSDFYEYVFPILNQNEQTATLFAVSDWLDQPKHLSSSQLLQIEKKGFDIQNHTKTHRRLGQLGYQEQKSEIAVAKEVLGQLLEQNQLAVATPYGNSDNDTVEISKSLDIELLFTGLAGIPTSELSNPYQLSRISLLQSHSFEEFKQFVD